MNLPTYITGSVQSQAYRLLREHVYAVLAKYDLTPTYWSMLGIIMEARDGVRQVEIANAMRVKAPLITAMSKQMQDRGIIQSVQNQFDARAKLLAITPSGRKYIKMIDIELNDALKKLLVGLNENDLTTYHKVLTTIISNNAKLEKQG